MVVQQKIRCLYIKKKYYLREFLAISKGKNGYTLAFVGTIDNNFTKIFSYSKSGCNTKNGLAEADYYKVFLKWAKSYWALYQKGLELIMVFR